MLKDVLLGCAAATTAIVAVIGLKNWSRELKGRAEFEAARNLIRATYKLRDEIARCRSPFMGGYEFPKEYVHGAQHSPEEEARGWAYVYRNRWEPVLSALQDFETNALEAEALWGVQIRIGTDELRQCVIELRTSVLSH